MSKLRLLSILILASFLAVAITPVAFSQDERPSWAKKTNYAEYDISGTFVLAQAGGENDVYSFSGSYRIDVLEVQEDLSTVRISLDRSWENGQKPPGVGEFESQEQEWQYDMSNNVFYIDRPTFENLKDDIISPSLENVYAGMENIEVPYGRVGTYHISQYENASVGGSSSITRGEYYYDINTGIAVKLQSIQETVQGSFETLLELKDTNIIREEEGSYWLWVAAGAIVLLVAAVVFMAKAKVE